MEKRKLKRLILAAGIILGNALLWSESASAADCNAFGNQGEDARRYNRSRQTVVRYRLTGLVI